MTAAAFGVNLVVLARHRPLLRQNEKGERHMTSISGEGGIQGPFMLVHEVTGTYLQTDNYNDDLEQAVQTWNLDPVMTIKGLLGHLWYIEPAGDGTYVIKSFENNRCLAAGVNEKDNPRLKNPDSANERQKWFIRRVHGSDAVPNDADSYAIIPKVYPGYALSTQSNVLSNNVYVVPTSMWEGPPSISQYWKLVPHR
ncbi:RICIN domain-containing protein [Nonomuraea sp. PA05]|uniref:RICIN domain-containing protein n=1 Tax=Nonomuraea sp. PA05 TaxID=2604466 RepID=UPI0011D310E8|nr:RICIN domain-containing protein [Nonomuraea sp. PA05]TYB57448.1 RICIN domain-containing protein [Nonomuraea sp. PA05]